MSIYALTPHAKADLFDIWSYIANDSEDAADRVEQAICEACAFVAKSPMRGYSPRPYSTSASFLDADPFSELRDRIPARDRPSPGYCRPAGKKKCTAYPETAPVTVPRRGSG